jgi:hypothetical protein
MTTVLKTLAGALGILILTGLWLFLMGFAFRLFYACFMLGWGLV